MLIGRNALRKKYGIDLPVGKFSIKVDGSSYKVYSVKDDTEGCILVGSSYSDDFVGNSRATFAKLFEKIESAYENDEILIEIK